MTAPKPIDWLVDDRHTGKTTALVAWLVEGEERAGYPGWSRVLLTSTSEEAVRLVRSYPGADTQVRNRGLTAGLSRVIVTLDEFRRRPPRPRWTEVEYAVDDADSVLCHLLGVRPSFVSASGAPVRAEISREEYTDLVVPGPLVGIKPEKPTTLVTVNHPNGKFFTIKTQSVELLIDTINGLPGVTAVKEPGFGDVRAPSQVTLKIMGDQKFAEYAIREQGYGEIVEVRDVT